MSSRLIAWLAVFLVMPASAAAINTPELTFPTGTRLVTESKVRATNVGEVKFTGANGTIACTSAVLTGTLTKNNGSELEASLTSSSITGTGGDGRCTGASFQTWVSIGTSCLRSTPELTDDEFQIRGEACSKSASPVSVSFSKPIVATECVYERAATITGTFTTHPSDVVFTAKSPEFVRVAGNVVLCFAAFKLDSSFTFENNEAGVAPLYISAGPTLTFPTGTKLTAGAKVRGHSVGSITLTSASGEALLQCSAGETTGTLKKNSGTEVEVDIEGASYAGTGTEE